MEKGKNGKYAYTISQNGKKTDATISAHDIGGGDFVENLFGRRSEKYHCTDKNGNTVVYNDKDVPIGTGAVKKIGPRSYELHLFATYYFLYSLQFSHPSSRDGDGTVHLTWPDCFDMGIDVTLPPAISGQGSYTPTNSELLEFWVSKRDPDRLLACQHAVVDYEIEGAKVKTNVLFEAATTANSVNIVVQIKKDDRMYLIIFFVIQNYNK
uniref:TAXi_C domain-containing protein n=1 Tax=Heterorhabditis bacteriophora TaxID=37862 RepID=A0A1I7WE34_HETBA